jgi:antitoxin ParD1/3/4
MILCFESVLPRFQNRELENLAFSGQMEVPADLHRRTRNRRSSFHAPYSKQRYNQVNGGGMASTSNTLVIDLGPLRKSVEDRVQSGSYASADEVIRAGILALEREEAVANEGLTHLAEESLADPRPSVPAVQVFRQLRTKYGLPASESAS